MKKLLPAFLYLNPTTHGIKLDCYDECTTLVLFHLQQCETVVLFCNCFWLNSVLEIPEMRHSGESRRHCGHLHSNYIANKCSSVFGQWKGLVHNHTSKILYDVFLLLFGILFHISFCLFPYTLFTFCKKHCFCKVSKCTRRHVGISLSHLEALFLWLAFWC